MRPWLPAALALAACAPASDPVDVDDVTPPADTDPPWWEGAEDDLDGDGVSRAEGDCDDGDPDVSPALRRDRCDARDDDCDGEVDEDGDVDPWEPNDVVAADLGRRADQDEVLLTAWAFPEGDVDVFRFYVPDPALSFFSVEAWTYGVPEDVDLALELRWVEDARGQDRGLVAAADALGPGGAESLDHGGFVGVDDDGWYELTVRATGARCDAPYTLQLLLGGL